MTDKHFFSNRLKKIVIFLLVLAVLAGTARFTISRLQAIQQVPVREYVGLPVQTAQVQTGTIKDTVSYSGTVMSTREAVVAPKLMAEIKAIHCSEGDSVRRGQILVQLDDSEPVEKINTLKTRVDSAQINLNYWEQEADTYKTLADHGAISRHEYKNILFKRDNAAAALKEAMAALEEARTFLTKSTLRSPFDGTVTSMAMDEGEMASPGEPVLTVSDTGSLKVVINVIEGDLAKIKDNSAAVIRLPGTGTVVQSRVRKIYPTVNPVTRTAVVEALVPEDALGKARLALGMSASVSIILSQKEDTFLVPTGTVKVQGKESFIFVVDGNKAVKNEVNTGINGDRHVEITKGISAPETVIINPPAELRDGGKIYLPGEAANQ